MDTLKNKPVIIFFLVLLMVIAAAYMLHSLYPPQRLPLRIDEIDNSSAVCFTIKDHQGNVIMQTGLPVTTDDEFINADDSHYVVVKVEGNSAVAELKEEKAAGSSIFTAADLTITTAVSEIFNSPVKTKKVVIYHTHNDESYIPTSGTDSQKEGGDILAVGKAFKESLGKANIDAVHSGENHYPHDINAYHRSRKTLVKLLKPGPDAAFDIHRDATPASAYHTSINGIDAAKVMIVVGRTNFNMQTNLRYAKRIKDICDQAHPGLIRGIFIGKGNYNQDLYPSALLFEIGSQNNSLPMAEIGARSLADAIAIDFARTE